jgi:hypothetical protein
MNLSQEIRARLNMPILDDPSHKLTAQLQRAGGHRQAVVTAFTIPKPNKEDVVLGRGKPYQSWPGNQLMLSLCDAYRDRYHSVERTQKNIIIEEVRTIISAKGGRFLGAFVILMKYGSFCQMKKCICVCERNVFV